MGWWLAGAADGAAAPQDRIQRFDPRFWTVNFPRPMLASVVTTGPSAVAVDVRFLRADDVAGLIWESADRFDQARRPASRWSKCGRAEAVRAHSAGFAASLAAETTALALVWRIVRSDGVALGFTAHDRPITLDGMIYRPAPGMAPSAVSASDGYEADAMEVAGVLAGDAISAADLEAGRYDGARVTLALVDWEHPDRGTMRLAAGALGRIERRGESFTAELRGAAHALALSPIELTSPECRAELGDERCRVDLAARTRLARVTAVDGLSVTTDLAAADEAFAYGRLRSIDGANAGIDRAIAASAGGAVTLRSGFPFAFAAGDRIELREGCDKRFATCRSRFGNAANFRGEPHLPGGDSLAQYPGL